MCFTFYIYPPFEYNAALCTSYQFLDSKITMGQRYRLHWTDFSNDVGQMQILPNGPTIRPTCLINAGTTSHISFSDISRMVHVGQLLLHIFRQSLPFVSMLFGNASCLVITWSICKYVAERQIFCTFYRNNQDKQLLMKTSDYATRVTQVT